MNDSLHLLNVTLDSNGHINVNMKPDTPSVAAGHSVKINVSPLLARFHVAQIAHKKGHLTDAQAIYEEILKVQPDHFGALHFLGVIAAQNNEFERAVELIGKSVQIQSNSAVAFNNYGNALRGLKNYEAALESYDKAIALDGNYADALVNRGKVLADLDRSEMALLSYERAIAIDPTYAEAYLDKGVVLVTLNQLDAALLSYDQAIAIQPNYADVHYAKSLSLLKNGDLKNGWVEYQWRWSAERSPTFRKTRSFVKPVWLGQESLNGKTILIYGEQGLGDMIQFCRYVELVAALGANVILEVPKPLLQLLANLKGVSLLVEKGTSLPPFDFHCSLMSLPLAFKTDLNHVPSSTAYIAADRTKVLRWLDKLGPAEKPRVGLVWSGSQFHSHDRKRSIELAEFVTHLPRNFQYISLQKEIRETDREVQKEFVSDFSDLLTDFSDTAALCACMDLVISVDTSVAHLSGALGMPTWIMVSFAPDWRWLLTRDDSPWYSSIKLYRQESRGDWHDVMRRVGEDLARRAT